MNLFPGWTKAQKYLLTKITQLIQLAQILQLIQVKYELVIIVFIN